MAWQRRSGYNRRSLVDTAMFRYKIVIGRRLQARTLSNQKTEAKIGSNVLNRMAGLGMPASAPGSADPRAGAEDATSSRSMHQRAGRGQGGRRLFPTRVVPVGDRR